MTWGLAYPLGLLALLGLALPLLVHLARREQQQPTMFAALRWLRAVRRPRQKLRLEQWLLLALRLLLVAGFAWLLASPWFLPGAGEKTRVLVHPSVSAPASAENEEQVWLAPGFPPIAEPAPDADVPMTSLLRQADAELPGDRALVVHVPSTLDGADGERPRLSRPVEWQVHDAATPADVQAEELAAPVMVIRNAPGIAAQSRWLAAAQSAWHASAGRDDVPVDHAAIDAPWPDDTKIIAWLDEAELPEALKAFAREGGTLLLGEATPWPLPSPGEILWRGDDGTPRLAAARFDKGRVLQFQQPLEPATFPEVLDARFPAWLQAHLQAPAPAPRRVDAAAYPPLSGAGTFEPPQEPLDPWLALVLAALFMLERWFAAGQPSRRPA